MAGAMAGSLLVKRRCHRTVTVVTNNECNFGCGMCYLSGAQGSFVSEQTVQMIAQSPVVERVIIVGKEPFANRQCVEHTISVVDMLLAAGKTVAAITNGVGLGLVDLNWLRKLQYLDITLHTTSEGLAARPKILQYIRETVIAGIACNALQVLSREALERIDETIQRARAAGMDQIVFSPLQLTDRAVPHVVEPPSYLAVCRALQNSREFQQWPEARILTSIFEVDPEQFMTEAQRHDIHDRVVMIDRNPVQLGVMGRVTVNGTFLSVLEASHTGRYAALEQPILPDGLDRLLVAV